MSSGLGAHGKDDTVKSEPWSRKYQNQNEPFIVCQQCSKSFNTEKHFVGHVNKSHSEMNNRCIAPRCGFLFTTWRGFVSYMENHCDLRLYHCSYCAKFFFITKSLLDMHEKSHKDHEYKFACHYCDKKIRQTKLTKHKDRSCPQNMEHAMKCKSCEYEVQGMPNVFKHMRCKHKVGGNFFCDSCHMLYMTEEYLLQHTKDRSCHKKGLLLVMILKCCLFFESVFFWEYF